MDLYCIFEAGKMDLKTLTRFWVKFFDINDIGKVEKEDVPSGQSNVWHNPRIDPKRPLPCQSV